MNESIEMGERDIYVPEVIHAATEACELRCAEHVRNFARELDQVQAPASVYHYTDSTGLLGILQSGKIRLTDVFGLNDTSELRHGVHHACEILAEKALAGPPMAKLLSEEFSRLWKENIESSAHYLVACFSRNDDDLSQWGAYGDDGRGFAIKFDGCLLEEAFLTQDNENNFGYHTFNVNYNDALLRNILQKIVGEALPIMSMPDVNILDPETINNIMGEIFSILSVCVIQTAIFFKHEAYSHEEEFRFQQFRGAQKPVGDLKLRARQYSLVRFTDFDWKTKYQHALLEIVIGPAAIESDARSFARECLSAGGFGPETVIIRRSAIPYRGK